MSRTADGFSAEIDGAAADVLDAARILGSAEGLTVLSEVLDVTPPPAALLGRARAARLHRIMGRLGLHEHYGIARRAAGLDVCYSLAALTEAQAREVWAYLCRMFPLDAHRAAAA